MNDDIPDYSTFDESASPPESAEFEPLNLWEDIPTEEMPHPEGKIFEDDQIIGDPEALNEFHRYQGFTADCALYTQGGVLEANGQTFDIEEYRQQGQNEGWYDPSDGTTVSEVGRLIEENGVPVKYYENGATFSDMAVELGQGHGVVVAVDTEPIWGEPGGHALWVTGLEVNADGSPANIICNDSGRPDGQGFAYPADQFSQAWDWQNNYMVATRSPLAALSG